MIEKENDKYIPPFEYTKYAGVKFLNAPRSYFFGTNIDNLKLGDIVVCETIRGIEIGTISVAPISIKKYESQLALKPILRLATKDDIDANNKNIEEAKKSFEIVNQEIASLKLDMITLFVEYVLDHSKVVITYVSENRVDFRELLKRLSYRLKTRIELRQIGSRDKAKMVGGIGICGLPLCCSTFLNDFESVSVGKAKNQMLAINIPKLSGHCGKFICCLKYEDDAYSEAKKEFPPIGEKVKKEDKIFKVASYNVLSKSIKIEGEEEYLFISLEEYNKLPKIKDRNDK